ncbi:MULTISPECIES: YbaB/EbfC family nucleoid-associated protein [Aestuariimicrobium]|uniref:YbaB/EbfC family nucleoid-associated protein n=1 Tax=Aestuariimicrobium TaxID=396388 RepID=UPI0003B33133|nr:MULTISPECIES: YbaB/EbfC family nucleoid-associated protein [Aestuariimicrobium]CAI9402051.1 Nucleoid-associated protein [Aestuariimicrobium sp. T2.26MG-19.2B]
MFGEGMDMNALLAQAQAMQSQLQTAQEELAASEFTGSAGGDLVVATVLGTGELTHLVIKPEAIDPDDAEGLADLVLAAVRSANSQLQAKAAAVMPQLPGGLGF